MKTDNRQADRPKANWWYSPKQQTTDINHGCDSLSSNLISGLGAINEDLQGQTFLSWLLHTNSEKEENKTNILVNMITIAVSFDHVWKESIWLFFRPIFRCFLNKSFKSCVLNPCLLYVITLSVYQKHSQAFCHHSCLYGKETRPLSSPDDFIYITQKTQICLTSGSNVQLKARSYPQTKHSWY